MSPLISPMMTRMERRLLRTVYLFYSAIIPRCTAGNVGARRRALRHRGKAVRDEAIRRRRDRDRGQRLQARSDDVGELLAILLRDRRVARRLELERIDERAVDAQRKMQV